MRALEVIAAVILGLLAFAVLKLIGVVIHIAVVGALIGLVAGFVIARALRKN